MEPGRHGNIDCHHCRNKRPQHNAALRPQIELVCGKHDADGETGENCWNHGGKNICKTLQLKGCALFLAHAEERPNEHLPEGFAGCFQLFMKRVAAGADEDQQGCHKECDADCHKTAYDDKAYFTFPGHDIPS